jgi:hypothetical protein
MPSSPTAKEKVVEQRAMRRWSQHRFGQGTPQYINIFSPGEGIESPGSVKEKVSAHPRVVVRSDDWYGIAD